MLKLKLISCNEDIRETGNPVLGDRGIRGSGKLSRISRFPDSLVPDPQITGSPQQFKLISFNINDAALALVPSAEEVLANPTVEGAEKFGLPMGEAFIRMAIEKGRIKEILTSFRSFPPVAISSELQEELDKIEWIDLAGGRKIMKREVTVKLFNLVMRDSVQLLGMEEYKIVGHNESVLWGILADPQQEGTVLNYVNWRDLTELAKRLAALIRMEVSLPTQADFEAAREQLLGWSKTWTDTQSGSNFILCCLASLDNGLPTHDAPDSRYGIFAGRLVMKV